MEALEAERAGVNELLWAVEDALRECEGRQEFVARARPIYQLNDRRAVLKRAFNALFGSRLVEEKAHPPYPPG